MLNCDGEKDMVFKQRGAMYERFSSQQKQGIEKRRFLKMLQAVLIFELKYFGLEVLLLSNADFHSPHLFVPSYEESAMAVFRDPSAYRQ